MNGVQQCSCFKLWTPVWRSSVHLIRIDDGLAARRWRGNKRGNESWLPDKTMFENINFSHPTKEGIRFLQQFQQLQLNSFQAFEVQALYTNFHLECVQLVTARWAPDVLRHTQLSGHSKATVTGRTIKLFVSSGIEWNLEKGECCFRIVQLAAVCIAQYATLHAKWTAFGPNKMSQKEIKCDPEHD